MLSLSLSTFYAWYDTYGQGQKNAYFVRHNKLIYSVKLHPNWPEKSMLWTNSLSRLLSISLNCMLSFSLSLSPLLSLHCSLSPLISHSLYCSLSLSLSLSIALSCKCSLSLSLSQLLSLSLLLPLFLFPAQSVTNKNESLLTMTLRSSTMKQKRFVMYRFRSKLVCLLLTIEKTQGNYKIYESP